MRKMKKGETLEGLMLSYNFNEADLLENTEIMGFNTYHEWDGLNMQRMSYKQMNIDNEKPTKTFIDTVKVVF